MGRLDSHLPEAGHPCPTCSELGRWDAPGLSARNSLWFGFYVSVSTLSKLIDPVDTRK